MDRTVNVELSTNRLSVPVCLDILEVPRLVDLNVYLVLTVFATWLVVIRDASILVLDRAGSEPNVRSLITTLFVVVCLDLVEILLYDVIPYVRDSKQFE